MEEGRRGCSLFWSSCSIHGAKANRACAPPRGLQDCRTTGLETLAGLCRRERPTYEKRRPGLVVSQVAFSRNPDVGERARLPVSRHSPYTPASRPVEEWFMTMAAHRPARRRWTGLMGHVPMLWQVVQNSYRSTEVRWMEGTRSPQLQVRTMEPEHPTGSPAGAQAGRSP